ADSLESGETLGRSHARAGDRDVAIVVCPAIRRVGRRAATQVSDSLARPRCRASSASAWSHHRRHGCARRLRIRGGIQPGVRALHAHGPECVSSAEGAAPALTKATLTLLSLPATRLIEMVARGACSAADLVRAHLDWIQVVNPTLNAFVEI